MFPSNLMLFPKSVEVTEKEKIKRAETLDRILKAIKDNVDGITEISRIDFELAQISMEADKNKSTYLLLGFPSYLVVSGVFINKQQHDIFWLQIIHKTDMFTKQSQIANMLGIPPSFEVESNYPDRALKALSDSEVRKFVSNMGEGRFSFFTISQIIEFKETLATILELAEEERKVLREIDRTPTTLIQNPTALAVYRKALMKEEELTKFQLEHLKESWDLEAFELIRRVERFNGRHWDDLKNPNLYSMSFCSETRDFSVERKAIYSLCAIHGVISGFLQ
ncbi:MAG: hypothetical protein ACE5I5_08355 [Candidatus Heimdallarchaeota archaeon]